MSIPPNNIQTSIAPDLPLAPAPNMRVPEQKVGRNDPCPCGSERKYKKCCLPDQRISKASANKTNLPRISASRPKARIRRRAKPQPRARRKNRSLDSRMVSRLHRFALDNFDREWRPAFKVFRNAKSSISLARPWALFHYKVKERSIAEHFIDKTSQGLTRGQRTWLKAHQSAWISLWEVRAVVPGSSITFEDLLSGEIRRVREVSASKTLVNRDVILGRIASYKYRYRIVGRHQRTLPPIGAAQVARKIRRHFATAEPIPVESLRDQSVESALIKHWEEAVTRTDKERSQTPELHNTDGDLLLWTIDHFEFDPEDHKEIDEILANLEGVVEPEKKSPVKSYVISRYGTAVDRKTAEENIMLGRIEIGKSGLRLEANSVERADELCERLEAACDALIEHHQREHVDTEAPKVDYGENTKPYQSASVSSFSESNALVLKYKQQHYEKWADKPLPVLEGKTPRQVLSHPTGREQVDVLIKHCEHTEARLPVRQRYDFNSLRQELGLRSASLN